jgi:DNA repair protein RadC
LYIKTLRGKIWKNKRGINMNLKRLPDYERPREKLLTQGKECLNNAELLAILLRTGTGCQNVIEVARELIKCAEGKLTGIMKMSPEKMCETRGIGMSKAVTVAAAFELGRRCALEPIIEKKNSITDPRDVCRIMLPIIRGLDHEECWGLFLNRANYLIGKECLSKGGLDSTVLDVKTIVRKALERKATSMIIVHNHPSGNPLPGSNDIRETGKLKKGLDTCGISLTDHVIIAEDSFYSFADEEATNIL